MKTEEQIQRRMDDIEGILNEENLNLSYVKINNFRKELTILNWVLGNVEDKNKVVQQKMNISTTNAEDKVIELLKNNKELTLKQMCLNSDYTLETFSRALRSLELLHVVKHKGIGRRNNPRRYSLI